MNAPAPAGLDWRAIGFGVAVGVGGTLAMSLLWALFPLQARPEHLTLIMLVSQGIGALIDIATGATAGWLAGRRGSMHGLAAGFLANVLSLLIGYTMTVVRTEFGRTVEEVMGYLAALLPWQIVGVVLATIAGTIAVRFRIRRA